ncbi:MAG: porin [Deltaproteobacteria bacterium]|nr:porin [Deltaproteobacteria bacterium]
MHHLKVWQWLTLFWIFTLCPFNALAVEWKGQDWNASLNGALRVSYNDDSIGTSTADNKSNKYLSGNMSHVQLTGSRMLKLGMKGIFKTEWGLDPTDTGEKGLSLKDMDQYLGLEGGFGMLRAGTMLTPYMQTGVAMDPYWRDALEARSFPEIQSGLHKNTGKGRGRSTNTLRYDSPMSSQGLQAQFFYGLDETPDNNNSFGTGFSFNSQYLSLFIQWYDNGEPGKDKAYKMGGEIKGGGASLFGQYEVDEGLISLADNLSPVSDPANADITAKDNNTHGADTWHTGLKYTNGKLLFIGQYGQRQDSKNGLTPKDGLTGWLAGISIYLDNTFYLYTGYVQKDFNDDRDNDSRFSIGATLTF